MFLLFTPAMAGLHTCQVTLEAPDGETTPVRGYGHSKARAQSDAESLAWTLADLRASTRWWGAAFGWQQSTGVAVPRGSWVPGYAVGEASCKSVKLKAEQGAWSATVAQIEVVRPDAETAVRAARRRACFSNFQDEFSTGFSALPTVAAAERGTALDEIFAASRKALERCLEARPTVLALQGQASPAGPDTVVCRALDVRRHGTVVSGLGIADSLHAAREAALWDHLRLRPRLGVAEAMDAAANASAEVRASLVAGALSGMAELVPPDPEGAQLALSCQTDSGTGALKWTPDPRLECEGPVSTEGWSTRTPTCWAAYEPVLGRINEALAHAPAEQRERWMARGISDAMGCSARCEAGISREPGSRVRGAKDPNFATVADARKALDRALAEGDASIVLGLLPLGVHHVASSEGAIRGLMAALSTAPADVTLLEMIDGRAWLSSEAIRALGKSR